MAYTPFISISRPATIGAFVGGKTVIERKPMTPFWVAPADGERRGIELDGADFLRQNHSAYGDTDTPPSTDLDIVCGNKTFRNYLETYTNEGPDCGDVGYEGHVASSSVDRHYDFTVQGNPIVTIVAFPGQPYYSYPRSAAEWNFDHGPADPPVTDGCSRRAAYGDASNEVTKVWLEGQLAAWQGISDALKDSLYDGFGSLSYASDSTEGWKLKIAIFEYRPQGHWFTGTNFGMTGDRGDHWNGKFSTDIIKQTRKNFPSLWLEATKRTSDGFLFAPDRGTITTGFPTTGESIYKAGYYEEELSDEITGSLVDEWGVFDFGGADNWDLALTGCPWRPFSLAGVPADNDNFLTEYSRGEDEGEAHDLMILSATGRRYRVTLQVGTVWPSWSTEQTVVVETDADTLRATQRFPDTYGKAIRVAYVDEWTREEWKRIADIEEWEAWKAVEDEYWTAYDEWIMAWDDWYWNGEVGPEPVEPEYTNGAEPGGPGSLIGSTPLQGKPMWCVAKWRNGSAFGFPTLNYSGSGRRWAKKTFRKHRTVGAFDTAGKTGCGSASITGNFDLEYEEEYVDGVLREKVLLEWEAVIAGVDWTPEDWTQFTYMPPFGDVYTETLHRHDLDDQASDFSWDQYASVSFDTQDDNGKLIAENTARVAMSIDGSANKGPWNDIDVPASGRNVYVPGHRLTYDPPS